MSPQADDVELTHLWAMRDATRRRLFALEEQSAHFGPGAPAHVDVEIAQATKDLEVLNAKLQTVQLSPDVVEAVGRESAATLLLDYRLKTLGERVDAALHQIVEKLGRVSDQLLMEQTIRKERQQEHDERMTAMEAGIEASQAHAERLDQRVGVVVKFGALLALVVLALLALLVWYLVARGAGR